MLAEEIFALVLGVLSLLLVFSLSFNVLFYDVRSGERRRAKQEKMCDYVIALIECMSVNGHPVITVDEKNKSSK